MIIKKVTENFITVELSRQDAQTFINALHIGIDAMGLPPEERTKWINSLAYLAEKIIKT